MAIRKRRLLLFGTFFIFLIFAGVMFYRFWRASDDSLASPVEVVNLEIDEVSFDHSLSTEPILPTKNQTDVVYGFLPYWNLKNLRLNRVVTHLAYFSLGTDGEGNILDGEPGYNNYYGETYNTIWNQSLNAGKNNEVVISLFNADEIWELLHCPSCRANLVNNVVNLVNENELSGVNIDFEYVGEVTPELRRNYTSLLRELRLAFDAQGREITLSIDIYGDGASMYNLWEMEELGEIVDYIIVMAYDYKTRSSTIPGPVAPTLGKGDWGNDILDGLRKLLEVVDPSQVILAVPFYGYEWQTTSLNVNEAETYPGTGATLTYERLQNLLRRKRELKLQEHWDDNSLSPYISYVEDGDNFIGFFENERSLGYKIDLAKGLNLGGIAIWALGYEGETSELWRVIEERL